jgi:acyl-ACP thioesterase
MGTLPLIGNYILDAASAHAQQRGFGFDAIVKDNVAWVLSRLSIEMYEYPSHNETLTVETYVEGVERFFTQRCFRFINFENRVIGYARSIWAAIDMTTRRPIDILKWRPDLADYITNDIVCPVDRIEKIHSVEKNDPDMGYTVRYSDIDINKHISSIKYIEHIINIFDLQMFKNKKIKKFEIVYLVEGLFGNKLKLYLQQVSENEYIIDTKRESESICRSRIVWN